MHGCKCLEKLIYTYTHSNCEHGKSSDVKDRHFTLDNRKEKEKITLYKMKSGIQT